jgi:hypothetical protein
MDAWRNTKETAQMVRRDERTVRRWCAPGGQLDGIALRDQDGQWQIPLAWIEEWLGAHAEPEGGTLLANEQYAAVMEVLREEVGAAVRNEMDALRLDLAAAREDTRRSEERRDQQLMAAIRALQEARIPWWRRLFNRR